MTVMTEVAKIAPENWFYRQQLAVIDQFVTFSSNENVWSLQTCKLLIIILLDSPNLCNC